MMTPAFPDPATLLPHGESARVINVILSRSEHGLVCRGSIRRDHPFVVDGRCPAYVGIEVAAQAAGVMAALDSALASPESIPADSLSRRLGYLVRAREIRFSMVDLPVGNDLTVRVRRRARVPPLAIYEVAVWTPEGQALAGAVSIYFDT